MAAVMTGMVPTFDLEHSELYGVFTKLWLEGEYRALRDATWSTDVDPIAFEVEPDDVVLQQHLGAKVRRLVCKIEGCLVRLNVEHGSVYLTVAGPDDGAALAVMQSIQKQLPATIAEDGVVPITFWSYGPHGPRQQSRSIDVPTWAELDGNYAARVAGALGQMMDGEFRPAVGGQLMLWQGVPGTGKTWALRALTWEWRSWANFHYVTDPENFFGRHADYMLDVILGGDEQPVMVGADGREELTPDQKWKVLILEDSGELIAADAKSQVGQGLARLLNVVDGLIGQGLKLLVLVTTNEEVKGLHPAITRPGRCAAQIMFDRLDAAESEAWLEAHELLSAEPKSRSIAELFALRDQARIETIKPPIGFTR